MTEFILIYRDMMEIEYKDRSLYLKGLLLLISKDNKISEQERNLVLAVGRDLGFEREFCENAIDEILENEYVLDKPSVFSSSKIAYSFICDGIRVALCDDDLHIAELEWLIQTATANSISKSEVDALIKQHLSHKDDFPEIKELGIHEITGE